jgi:hypothetical protein
MGRSFSHRKFFFALTSYLFLNACDEQRTIPTVTKPLSEITPSLMPLRTVVAATPGDIVSIKGKNLSSRIALFINEKPTALKILDDENASFIVPEDDDSEQYQLSFKIHSQPFQSFSLAKSSALGNLPVVPIALDFVCDSVIFRDQSGAVVRGQAKCGLPTLKACTSDGEIRCEANEDYKAASTMNIARKILVGETIAGVSGSAPLKPDDCLSDGEGDCVVDGLSFKAAKLSLFSAHDIRSSARIAGIQGHLPNCSSDGEIGCLTLGPSYAAASLSGASAKILSGQTLAGVIGSAAAPPANCSMDNDINCVATPAFPAVVKANVSAGMIKAGSIIAGVNGAYPSATYPLASNTATTDLKMFQSQLTTNGSFEFFDSEGTRYTGSGDSDLVPANLRSGTTIESLSLNGIMPAVLPPAPSTLTSMFFTTPDRMVLNWTSVPGAAGYMLVARAGSAVTFAPTRTQTYSAGAQGSDTILYVGTDLTFVHNGILGGNSYNYAVYSYDSNRFYSAVPIRTINTSLFCQGLAGGSWVAVPGDATYGTSDFCVQKFEAKDVGGVPTSQAALSPWVSISQTTSITVCRALGPTYDLISNAEWLTIGANIAQVPSNWSSGTVGVGTINRGHSDNNPTTPCAASSDDTLGWLQTDCTPKNSSADVWSQKRTHTLSTGAIIWDIAGSVWEWTSYVIPDLNAKPYVSSDGAPVAGWREFSALDSSFTSLSRGQLTPTNAQKAFWSDSWASSIYGMGQYNSNTNGSGGALRRGANWTAGGIAGLFAVVLDCAPSTVRGDLGMRCVAHPPSP